MINMNLIKGKLEAMQCPECGKTPSVTISGDGFKLKCCCDGFKSQLIEVAKDEIAKQSKKSVEDELGRIFKKF